jgi:hypothetical protein
MRRFSTCAGAALCGALAIGGQARAQVADPGASTAPALPAICTDRPTKSNYACTVEAGHFQYEADAANGTFLKQNGVSTDTWLVINPTLKYGVTSNIDVEANVSPFESVRTAGHTETGVSDLYLRVKYEFLNLAGGAIQSTILPYVKAPTARLGIGNGAVEGGTLFPTNFKLNSILTLTTVPEIDIYKNAANTGRHLNTAQLINLGISMPRNFTLYGEVWGDWNFDPSGHIQQTSADAALAYGVTQYLQLDVGANFGLNRATPGLQAYVGVSQKF